MKTYRGFSDTMTIVVDDGGGPRFLKPKNEEIGFAWGSLVDVPGRYANVTEEEAIKLRQQDRDRAAGINQTVLAIVTDLLGSEEAAVKVYQRVKHLTVLKWPKNDNWVITAAELHKMIEGIEQRERETEFIRRQNHMRDVVSEGGAGIEWDTDLEGRRKRPY